MRSAKYLLALSLLSLSGCTSTTAPVDARGTLFEIEYVNFAWVPTWRGVVIDTAGTIHAFDLEGRAWEPDNDELIRASELESKWSHNSSERGTVTRGTLAEMYARVPGAAAGKLTDPITRCADAGVITYSAYTYDPERDAFRRVVLRREGDLAQLNDSGAGRSLAEWLISLDLLPRMDGCQP